jgi:hypothetical protein
MSFHLALSPNGLDNLTITELWKDMCFKCYPLAADRYHSGLLEEPESWRDQFFVRIRNLGKGYTEHARRPCATRKQNALKSWGHVCDTSA